MKEDYLPPTKNKNLRKVHKKRPAITWKKEIIIILTSKEFIWKEVIIKDAALV